jgi:hypothetical protein
MAGTSDRFNEDQRRILQLIRRVAAEAARAMEIVGAVADNRPASAIFTMRFLLRRHPPARGSRGCVALRLCSD